MCLFGGLLVGGVLAYVQDVLEDHFASPEDITRQLGVPVLALVRRLEPLEGEGLEGVHMFRMPTAPETETFRTLRTALTLQADSTERILVSSAEPSDGKTTVTANLAVSFAQAGKRTLVIDADLRKPGLTVLLGLRGQPGVADVLYGEDDAASAAVDLVRHTELRGLDVLPAGLRRPNPAELLGGPTFVELLAWAEANYDQVLVDCPPVLAVSDAQIVGRLVDGAIVVVQPHKNHRRLVVRACHSFAATGTNVLGVVANGLSPDSGPGYGYGYGYDYGYEYGEGSAAEESELAATTVDEIAVDDSVDGEGVISIEAWNAAAANHGKGTSVRAA
jgi:polysaccharide biosynthesis transport protein